MAGAMINYNSLKREWRIILKHSYSSKDVHIFLRYLAYPYNKNRLFVYLFLFLPSIFESFRDFKALSISKGVLDCLVLQLSVFLIH